jgi:hypothetical protein
MRYRLRRFQKGAGQYDRVLQVRDCGFTCEPVQRCTSPTYVLAPTPALFRVDAFLYKEDFNEVSSAALSGRSAYVEFSR